jgi:molybdate transport system permease protein
VTAVADRVPSTPTGERSRRRRAHQRSGVPFLAIVLAFIAVAFFVIPLIGLLQRAPWGSLWDELSTPTARDAMRLSLECSLWATGLSVFFGLPLAWVLARVEFPGRSIVRALTLLPLVLPPVVGGVALLLAFSRNSLIGGWLHDWFGVQLTFSKAGTVLAETFVAMPFFVITVEAGLRSTDRRYEEAAATLGAKRWTVFRRVTLPMILPSIAAGAALSWARALGEFGATITFAGNIQGRTQTTPLAVYLLLQNGTDAAIALSLVLLTVSVLVLVLLRDRWLVNG